MKIVLDANLIAGLVLPLPFSDAARFRLDDRLQQGASLFGPALWSYEVASVLRKFIVAGYLTQEELDEALERVWKLRIDSVQNSPDLQRQALAWAARLGQSKAYGGAYLAAAESLGAELWTADQRLAQAAHAAGAAWVKPISW